MKINPRTITYVKAIAEQRSFSRAAEKLYITQPSLSQHIINVEKEYGVQFFDRRSNPITLTYAGEQFLKIANKMEFLDQELSREMEDINGGTTGRISVGVSPTRGAWFIPKLFAQFKKQYPNVELKLIEGHNKELLEDVHNGKVDFAFTGYGNSDLKDIVIDKRHILLAVNKNSSPSPKDDINLADFLDEPFVLLKKGRGIRRIADKLFERENIHPIISYETSNYNMAVKMTQHGLGNTFVVDNATDEFSGLQLYHIKNAQETYQLHLVYRTDIYMSRPLQYFIDLAKSIN